MPKRASLETLESHALRYWRDFSAEPSRPMAIALYGAADAVYEQHVTGDSLLARQLSDDVTLSGSVVSGVTGESPDGIYKAIVVNYLSRRLMSAHDGVVTTAA